MREQIRLPDGSQAGVLVYGLLKCDWPAVRKWSVQRQKEWQASEAGRLEK